MESSHLQELYQQLGSRRTGLSSPEADKRLKEHGPNTLKPQKRGKGITLFLSQFKSPLILLLIGAAILSYSLGGKTDSTIIFSIVFLSGLLSFFQEQGAVNAIEKLLQMVENKVTVLRDGKEIEISLHGIVPGDVLILRAGDIVPADCTLIEATHFFVDEATLTGESVPVEKEAPKEDKLFMGTLVASGVATAIVVATGKNTEYSSILEHVRFRPPETAFELGVRRFGYLLLEITLMLVMVILSVNITLKKPVIDSFMFALALAVGLTPQLLPAIISVNLSHGARRMAQKKVIVKRLASIENFGQMNVLCSDKTGTLTQPTIVLEQAVGIDGKDSKKTALYGFLNAHFQAGYHNPLDVAILNKQDFDISGWKKTDEIPYDFIRKRITVIFDQKLLTKGAFSQILAVCDRVELPDGKIAPLNSYQKQLESYFDEQSQKGFRTLAVAYGETPEEKNLIFLGFLHFSNPLKQNIAQEIERLKRKGVQLKIITGDHHSVAAHVASAFGIAKSSIVTGKELHTISDSALMKIAEEKHIFAEIEPNQKERIILALRRSGHVVGYLGDGVNDVSALHSADVGIAVNNGADAAKEIADIVLLEKDLTVLHAGIEEGRRTFLNTMKYVYMASSANLGNMFSMAGASLFLPFLPLLPKQVLLTNFFSDLPEMALATDRVDSSTLEKPVKWDIRLIQRFMIVFGLLNSMADFMIFGVLLWVFHANETLFQSGWFIENVVSAALIVLAIRTRRPMLKSRPGRLVLFAVLAVALLIPFLPYTSLGRLFGLIPLPMTYYGYLAGIVVIYILSVEIAKRFFFRKNHRKN